MGPDSDSTKLLDHPKTKGLEGGGGGGGRRQVNSCRKVLFCIAFYGSHSPQQIPPFPLLCCDRQLITHSTILIILVSFWDD